MLEQIQGPGMVVKDGRDGFSEELMLKLGSEGIEEKCFKDYIGCYYQEAGKLQERQSG